MEQTRTVTLQIADIVMELDVDQQCTEPLHARYGRFLTDSGPAQFRLSCHLELQPHINPIPNVTLKSIDDFRFVLQGECEGWLDLTKDLGALENGIGFGSFEALIRLSLSLLAPLKGWILFHAAAIDLESGGCALLLGHSNAGKSTAARAFSAMCDEWVLLRVDVDGILAAGTPYWNGVGGYRKCDAIICLERSDHAALQRLTRSEAIRALLPHVIRHVLREQVDCSIFQNVCAVAGKIPTFRSLCPTGLQYINCLSKAMMDAGLAAQRRGI